MNYLLESFFVGIYCCFIYCFTYLGLSYAGITVNVYLMLFSVGFLKHFFGYFLNIHDYYCKYGCVGNVNKNARAKRNDFMLTGESILEGIVFIILGSLLALFIKSKLLLYFILGVGFILYWKK